ncbi:hypothetical protein ACFO0N_07005 [Halobium salinum]|uniref:Capsule polysaccharide biosynthesis protein n=1 Tax=Halobium salinum TaxID=1364940 RepID=A0ABD5PB70_9EURY|nr:hypothetical protein [Halobium salinum]
METELDTFGLTIDDVPVWERARVDVWWGLLTELGYWGQAYTELDYSIGSYLKGGYHLFKSLGRRNPFFSSTPEFLCWGLPRRKRLPDGTWWDIYFDPIYQETQLDRIHVEEPYQNDHLKPARTKDLKYLDVIEYVGFAKRKLGIADPSLSSEERGKLGRIESTIQETFGVELDVTSIIRYHLEERRSTLSLYQRLLRRLDPDVAVITAGTTKETFIEVCKNNDVPVVELQLGMTHEYSLEYSYPGFRTKETAPDYYLTFGPHWNTVADYPIDHEKVIDVGYPFLERSVEKYEDVPRRNQVVFVSQGVIGERLSKVATEASERLGAEVNVVFKPHPGESDRWSEAYPWLLDSDVEVVTDDDQPLHRVFAESWAQVGSHSMALCEGIAFGLDTYLLQSPGIEWMSSFIERGEMVVVDGTEELVSNLKDRSSVPVRVDRYFSPDAIENISRVLKGIREGRI